MARLTRNVLALYAVQLAQVALPLVSIPYLTRILQPEGFGMYAFAQALAQYFVLVVNYSTAWTAVRHVARQGGRSRRLRYVVSLTASSQMYLLVVCTLVFAVLNASVGRLHAAAPINWAAFVAVLGYALFPVWLFQGLEALRTAAILMIASRLVSVLLLFVFVKSPDDTVIAALLVALPTLVAGLISWPMLKGRLGGLPVWVGVRRVHRYLRREFEVFMSRVSQSFFSAAAPVVLGFVSTQHQLAFFSLTDKVVTASLNSYLPISQAVYPRLCNLYRRNPGEAVALLRRTAMLMIGVALLATLGLVLLAKYIIWFVAGSAYADAWVVMAALGHLPLLKALTNLLGMQMLAPLGYEHIVARTLWAAGLCNIAALVPVCWAWGALGAALLVVGTECLIILLLTLVLLRYRVLQHLGIFEH